MEKMHNLDHDFNNDSNMAKEALEKSETGEFESFAFNNYLDQDIKIVEEIISKYDQMRPVMKELRKTIKERHEQKEKLSPEASALMELHVIKGISDKELEQWLRHYGEYEYLAILEKERDLRAQRQKYLNEIKHLEELSKKNEDVVLKLEKALNGENPYGKGDIKDN